MPRKKWSPAPDITPSLLKSREKRKWQIALRRYILEGSTSSFYAPYFGLDIKTLRRWFEIQFNDGTTWENFGEKWQFSHILPVTWFDHTVEQDLMLCWNFINLKVEPLSVLNSIEFRPDLLLAHKYFAELHKTTNYSICLKMLKKIQEIEASSVLSTVNQQQFILENKSYLDVLDTYTAFEFDLLNNGRTIAEIRNEVNALKKIQRSG